MTYNRNWAIEKSKNGEELEFLFFWGHQPSEDGSVTKSCFSQWWVAPFIVDGESYQTAEHWMMTAKAKLFNDKSSVAKILQAPEPLMAKKLGREVASFNPLIWDAKKVELVVQGNVHKFSQNESLKKFLLSTGNKIIVEAAPRDTIWGIGLGASNPKATNPALWRGENLLGFALMEVRDKLRNNE